MATILVVDDSPIDRHLAGNLLEKRAGMTALDKRTGMHAIYANNGIEALEVISKTPPDLVLTDLLMPDMNGLELTEEIKRRHPLIPVILMTAHGSEDIAIQALQKGAASYVPKRNLAQELIETVENVLDVSRSDQSQKRLLECLTQTESHFTLDNDIALIPPLIGHLQSNLNRMKVCDENGLIRVAVALREALVNAIQHGNMEVSSSLREKDEKLYHATIDERRQQEPYMDRRVHIIAKETRAEAVYIIRDEGPGFDPRLLPDPTDPTNLEKVSGRGLLLIRTFMDEVEHNSTGNEITMVKRCYT